MPSTSSSPSSERRRRLLEHDDIEDTIGRLHQTADAIKAGPERLDTFDEDLFEDWWRRSWQRARLASGSGSMAELSWQRKSEGKTVSYRKILYGYQIQNGELTLVPEEAAVSIA